MSGTEVAREATALRYEKQSLKGCIAGIKSVRLKLT
jgi:hypothetical protein